MTVSVTGEGEYKVMAVLGEVGLLVGFAPPIGRPPLAMPGGVPLDTELGKTEVEAVGYTASGEQVVSDPIEIDVEPTEIPPVTFTPEDLFIPRHVYQAY